MTPAEARAACLALPEATEGMHCGRADLRVRGRIFASLDPAGAFLVLKFRPEQQALRCERWPGAFLPVPGGWGRQGWTRLVLAAAEDGLVRDAAAAAWRNVAPKRLGALLDQAEGGVRRDAT